MAKSPNKKQGKQRGSINDKNYKDKKGLVGRVRTVVKKSRRKLSEEKFKKDLQRTISFLTELRDKLSQTATHSSTTPKIVSKTAVAKPQPKVAAKQSTQKAKVPAKPAAKVAAAKPLRAKTAKKV